MKLTNKIALNVVMLGLAFFAVPQCLGASDRSVHKAGSASATVAAAATSSTTSFATREINMTQYLRMVAENNIGYLAEKYNVPMADAEVAIQKIFPDPELSFEAADEAFVMELEITLELGKRRSRVGVAKTQAEIERLSLEWFFQELRAEAASAYLDALMQKDLMQVRRSSYEYMAQISSYDSLRCILGEISEIDARQSSIEAATLRNELYAQQGEYMAAIAQLNLFMGDESGVLSEPAGEWSGVQNRFSLGQLIDLGLEHRVDLMAAGKARDLALRNIRMVKAERRPDIGLMVGYEKDWKGFLPRRQYMKVGVSVPLQFSNINRSAVKQANFGARQEEARLRNSELEVRTEVTQHYFLYEALRQQVALYDSGLLDEAQALMDGMTFRYKRGEIDILDLLIAQRTYNEVQEQYLETMMEYAASVVELHKSAGIWELDM